jgi:non-ribosomal peptide synthetase component E (peptide arylation enzyme)
MIAGHIPSAPPGTGLDRAAANRLLHEAGFSGICRIDEVRSLEAIPLLGTGKTNYRALRDEVREALSPSANPLQPSVS